MDEVFNRREREVAFADLAGPSPGGGLTSERPMATVGRPYSIGGGLRRRSLSRYYEITHR